MIGLRECEQTIPYQQIAMKDQRIPNESIFNQMYLKQKTFRRHYALKKNGGNKWVK